MSYLETLRKKQEAKAFPHLIQYAPVWLAEEIVIEIEEAIQFNVVFRHVDYGWVNRRYRYDGFNDTLYYKGQTLISEETAIKLQEVKLPWLETITSDVPNSYGG
ncbi:hypothetical protein MASR2M15_18380 [Anaerolineales bacterium]